MRKGLRDKPSREDHVALGGEASNMRKQMQEDPGGYGRTFIAIIIIGFALTVGFYIFDDDDNDKQPSEQTETTTSSVLDRGHLIDQEEPSAEEIEEAVESETQETYEEQIPQDVKEAIESEKWEAYEEQRLQEAEEYMREHQWEPDGFEGQPY